MMPKPSLRDLSAAPELLEVWMAEVALQALDSALRLVHAHPHDQLLDPLPSDAPILQRALRLIDTCSHLQRQLRSYRRAVIHDMRPRPNPSPF
jgi:hypothetical protein